MRLGTSTFVYFTSQLALSLAGFIATFLIARLLGAEVLGTYVLTVALVFWLNIPTMSVTSAMNKRISEGRTPGEFLTVGFFINSVLAVLVSIGIVTLGGLVNEYVGAPVAELLAAIFLANVALSSVMGALDGQKKVASRGVLQALEQVGRTGAQVALMVLGWGLTGLLVGHSASLMVAAVLGLLLFEIRPSLPSREHFRSVVEYARYSWLGTLKTRAFGWMDTIVLAFFVSSTLIGIYEVAWRLASILTLVSMSVQHTLFPELSELGVEEANERIHHLLNEGLVFTGVFCIPGIVGAALLGDRLLKIYSPEFTRGATILVILIGARTVSVFGSQFLSAINAVDRPDVAFRINLAFVVANLFLNVLLIFEFGWYGAAVATTLSAGLSLVLGYRELSRLIGRPAVPVHEIIRQVMAASLMAIILTGAVEFVPRNHYATIGLVFLGATVYTGALLGLSTRVRGKAMSLLPYPIRA